jgi:hypothetical protein
VHDPTFFAQESANEYPTVTANVWTPLPLMMVEVATGCPLVNNCAALQEIAVVPEALWHDTVTSDAETGSPAQEPAEETASVAVRFLALFFGTEKLTVTEDVGEAASGSDAVSVGEPLIDLVVGAAKKKKPSPENRWSAGRGWRPAVVAAAANPIVDINIAARMVPALRINESLSTRWH